MGQKINVVFISENEILLFIKDTCLQNGAHIFEPQAELVQNKLELHFCQVVAGRGPFSMPHVAGCAPQPPSAASVPEPLQEVLLGSRGVEDDSGWVVTWVLLLSHQHHAHIQKTKQNIKPLSEHLKSSFSPARAVKSN